MNNRLHTIVIHKLPWMEQIKALTEKATWSIDDKIQANPAEIIGKTVIVVEINNENSHLIYHFAQVVGVEVGDDTATEIGTGMPVSYAGNFSYLIVNLPGHGLVKIDPHMDYYTCLKQMVDLVNREAAKGNKQQLANDERFYFYNMAKALRPACTKTPAKRKPAKKLNSFLTPEGKFSSQ